MLAARVPTKISRQDLNLLTIHEEPENTARNHAKRSRSPSWSNEASAYVVVSFLYALGQALYDIFQSQQAKKLTREAMEAHGFFSGNHQVAAYMYAILVSAYAFTKALSSPYIGYLSDRFGRRRVLVYTLLATSVCLYCCGYAESYAGVLCCRLATGAVANGGLLTARAADIASDHAQRRRLFGLFTTAWAVARVAAVIFVQVTNADLRCACRAATVCELAAALLAAVAFKDPAGLIKRRLSAPRLSSGAAPPVNKRPSMRALFKNMLGDRLALMLFVTSMLTPRVDAAAFVSKRFGESRVAEAVGVLKALEAVCVVLVGLAPQLGNSMVGNFGDAGATVAAASLVALAWFGIAAAPSMRALYVLVAVRSAFAALYDPAARSLVWARAEEAAKRSDVTTGSMTGLQQSLKGVSQVFGAWLGAYLTSLSVALPLGMSAVIMIANAVIILGECVWKIPKKAMMKMTQRHNARVRLQSPPPSSRRSSANFKPLADDPKHHTPPEWLLRSVNTKKPSSSDESLNDGSNMTRTSSSTSLRKRRVVKRIEETTTLTHTTTSSKPAFVQSTRQQKRAPSPVQSEPRSPGSHMMWPIRAVFSEFNSDEALKPKEQDDDDTSSHSPRSIGGSKGRSVAKRARLVCRGEAVVDLSPPVAAASPEEEEEEEGLRSQSVGDVARWLKERGQAIAARQVQAAGVDGVALAIATAEELYEALEGKVSRLVCRSILLTSKEAFSSNSRFKKLRSCSLDDLDKTDNPLNKCPTMIGGLDAKGRAEALALRTQLESSAPPALVVVAPQQAAVQTALLAFGGTHGQASSSSLVVAAEGAKRPIFVAHDAARPKQTQARRARAKLDLAELQLEYGAQVDFAVCDDALIADCRRKTSKSRSNSSFGDSEEDNLTSLLSEERDAADPFADDDDDDDDDEDEDDGKKQDEESSHSLARRVYGLLSFVCARTETDVAIVADADVLEALVSDANAETSPSNLSRPFTVGELRDLRVDFYYTRPDSFDLDSEEGDGKALSF